MNIDTSEHPFGETLHDPGLAAGLGLYLRPAPDLAVNLSPQLVRIFVSLGFVSDTKPRTCLPRVTGFVSDTKPRDGVACRGDS